jgi:hypothetical protein
VSTYDHYATPVPPGTWDVPADPANVMATPDEFVPIYGSRQWNVLNQAEREELGLHLGSWLFSQFLHGEQGALTVAARIVESVPDMDSKFYAATQTMDEARHVQLYQRFIRDKIGLYYPINDDRIVPCVRDIGRWGPKVQHAYTDLGVLEAAGTDLDALMRDDEEIAERIDQDKASYGAEMAACRAEVDAAIGDAEG